MKKTMRAIVLVMACLLMLTAFVSCGKSAESVKEKAEKKGYKYESATAEELKSYSDKYETPITEAIRITDEATGDSVTAFFFENKKDAKSVRVNIEESLQALSNIGNVTVERKGKAVVLGNPDMIDNIW